MRTQFAESCAHVKESLKNYKPENSLLDDYCAEGEEEMYVHILHTCIAKPMFLFRHEKDVEKNQIKYFSKKVANIKHVKQLLIICVHIRTISYGDILGLLYTHT